MPIEIIHTCLVHPGKGRTDLSAISGTEVPNEGKLFALLDDIYSNSSKQCDIDISFNSAPDGRQENACRSLLLAYLTQPSIEASAAIGERLRAMTDGRSGLGLMFIIKGVEGDKKKVVISRFPANTAILAEENRATLTVAFLERVFVKHATTFKAATFEDASLSAGFWLGKAVDRQINNRELQLSNYWITDFLDAGFRTTPVAGTRRLAAALSAAAARTTTDVETKHKIAAVATLAGPQLAGETTSIRAFCQRFGLTGNVETAILKEVKKPELANEQFQFDASEFAKQAAYRSVFLDSGGILMAPTAKFDDIFERELIDGKGGRERFSAEGRVINERLLKRP